MLSYYRINDDFSNFYGKSIIIYGLDKGILIQKKLEEYNIEVNYFAVDIESNYQLVGNKINNIPIINLDELVLKCKSNEKCEVIIGFSDFLEQEKVNKLRAIGINNIIYMFSEFCALLSRIDIHKNIFNDRKLYLKKIIAEWNINNSLVEKDIFDKFTKERKDEEIIINYSPGKTGNHTITATLDKYNRKYINLWHTLKWVDNDVISELKKRTKKIIIGIRDPIAQNVSWIFQVINEVMDIAPYEEDDKDVQKLFDKYIVNNILMPNLKTNANSIYELIYYKMKKSNHLIQNWFEEEIIGCLNIDIFANKVDREAAYNIIRVGDMEIFIYKLERINEIEEELSKFCSINDLKLEKGNEGKNKWYSESYKEFIKKVRMPKEYFSKSYESKYVNFFYSDEEINKFKQKWESNIFN